MKLKKYLKDQKLLYDQILGFINQDGEIEFTSLIDLLQKYQKKKENFQNILYIIAKISKNHKRSPEFLENIKQILSHFGNYIKHTFSNIEIYKIFEDNLLFLLFLIENDIFSIDQAVFQQILPNTHLCNFFNPEIKPFLTEEDKENLEKQLLSIDPNYLDRFDEKRRIGENDWHLCELIRHDFIEEFVTYVNQTNLSLSRTIIKYSIFETNSFLIKNKNTTLIEYAAFCGSFQICQFLRMNDVDISDNVWLCTIHSNNAELFHLLEEDSPKYINSDLNKYLKESIKCHHNNIADYIVSNYTDEHTIKNDVLNQFDENVLLYGFRYCNYEFLPVELNHKFSFFYSCKYNHLSLLKLFIKKGKFDVNEEIYSTI